MENHVRSAIITNSHLFAPIEVDLRSIEDIFERIIWINLADKQALLWISFMNLGGMAGIEKKHELAKSWARTQKRVFDLFGSIIGLLILSPFLAIVAVLIKLDSSGPVFYRQTRIGKDGKNFQMLKYRTMYQDADQELYEYYFRYWSIWLDIYIMIHTPWVVIRKIGAY